MKQQLFHDLKETIAFLGKKKYSYLGSMIGYNIIESICYNIILAIVMKLVLEAVEYQKSNLFWEGCFIAVSSFLIAFLFGPVLLRIKAKSVRTTIARIRIKLVDRITAMSVSYFETKESGDLLTRTTQDLGKMEQIYLNEIPVVCFALIHGGIAISLMLKYNIVLGIVALLLGIMQSVINIVISMKIKQDAENRQKSYGVLLQSVIEILDGWSDVMMSHSKYYFWKKFESVSEEVLGKEEKVEKTIKKAITIDQFFGQINYILVMGIGLFFVLQGYVSVGTVAAMIRLQGNATFLFQNISDFMTRLADALPSVGRVIEMVEFEGESEVETEGGKKRNVSSSEAEIAISLKNLSFGYKKDDFIVKDLSLEIPKGKFVILMGDSGSGKSTLGKLLLRFYKENSGEYSIFGKDSLQLKKEEIREQIAYMEQRNTIFSMSVIENLRLVCEDASEQEVIEVCKMAGAHEFIMEFEQGYHYQINENVNNLSGGQKQRIALARMFLSKRSIYLIDEGTANLDEKTEELIVQNIVKNKGTKTILMITHRKNLIPYADIVYNLVNGRIQTVVNNVTGS